MNPDTDESRRSPSGHYGNDDVACRLDLAAGGWSAGVRFPGGSGGGHHRRAAQASIAGSRVTTKTGWPSAASAVITDATPLSRDSAA
jgi:hypothetical protein